MALADVPGLGAYIQQSQMNQQQPLADIQQMTQGMGFLQALQSRQSDQAMKALLAQTGGDVEKAVEIAVKSGNLKAANELAPLVKLQQERKMREQTPTMLSDLNRQFGPQQSAAPAAPVAPDIPTASPADAMVMAPGAPGPANAMDDRQRRIAHLTSLSMIPQYANNPVVAQRLQAEIDKLTNIKPMVEHNFSVGGDQVQPHISFDEGRSWQPVPGSKPSAKFAKQVDGVTGPDNGAQPTADTLEMDAWRYLTDGTLPTNMGRGAQGSGQATAIRNRASALAKDMGMTPDEIRMAQLTNKGQVAAIGQLAKAKAQILQFEKTASMNADLALQASEKVDRTGVPLFNRWLQAGRTAIAGDTEAAAFNAANETFVSEYAKVMSGGYGASATTEGAQSRAHTLLNTANTKEQYQRVVQQLKAEMGNRVKALNGQMDEEKQNLRRGVHPTPGSPNSGPTSPNSGAAPAGGPRAGEKSTSKSGKPMTFDGTQWNYD